MTDPSDNTENILVDFDAGVFTITFNRPTKKNAFSVAMYESMTHAFASARERADVRVIVLRGSEGMFTAGNDLMDFMRRPPTGPVPSSRASSTRRGNPAPSTRRWSTRASNRSSVRSASAA